LGVLVAFNWLSWSVIKHWAILLSTILGLVWTRDRLLLTKLWDLVYSVDNSLFANTTDCSAVSIGTQIQHNDDERAVNL